MKDLEWLKKAIKYEVDSAEKKYKERLYSSNEPMKGFRRGKWEAYDKSLRIIDQVEQPETLSQEWIDEHAKAVTYDGIPDQTEIVYVDDLQSLLVPKREKVAIPQDVADWLDDNIERYKTVYSFIISLVEVFGDTVPEKVWTYASENPDTMARAYLDGYEVEEEQKYYIMDKNYKLLLYQFRYGEDKQPIDVMGHYTIEEVKLQNEETPEITLTDYQFTEQEIKDYDERFWPFAEEVTE